MPASFIEENQSSRNIVAWSGGLADIPPGWVVCDGNNGTPDLTNRFIKATAAVTWNARSTGGQDTVSLSESQIPSHSHSGVFEQAGGHDHTFYYQTYNTADSGNDKGHPDGGGNNSHSTDTQGDHSHSVSDSYTTGAGDPIDNRPAFYETAFISPR